MRQTVLHALGGLVCGYTILHPMAMAVFAWLDPHDASRGAWPLLEGMVESFGPAMLPMGIVFALFGLLLGAIDGYYRSLVGFQRNDLARELQFNESYRQELERQNDRLRDLEHGKRRMTRFLVHDLKNHLGCVLGYAEVLLNRARNKDRRQHDLLALERIKRQASLMASTVADLLDLARLEEVPGIVKRRIKALTVLEGAVASAALSPGQALLHIDQAIDPELEVVCDSALVARVLSNLILNAAKHNRRGVIVTLNVYRKQRAVVFECRDTGNGIAEDIAEQLFDEFSTSGVNDQSTMSHGLGLAFCKAAVTAHGGRIWVDAKTDQRTTFAFTIPDEGTAT